MRRWAIAGAIFGVATALGLVSAWQMHTTLGRPLRSVWIVLNLSYFYLLLLLLPAVGALARRYRPGVAGGLALGSVHAVGFLLTWCVYSFVLAGVRFVLGLAEAGITGAWWRYFIWAGDWILVAYAATVLAAWAMELGREADERSLHAAILATDVANARLGQIRARLDPDRLFATFLEIASLVESDPTRAEELLHRQADGLRQALAVPGSVAAEVRHAAGADR